MVYEAIGPVIKSSIEDFTSSGINGHFVVLRYDGLLDEHLDEMKDYCDGELGKPYDIYFNWDDTEIYCSELVWKAYAEAKISLCDLRPLSNYNLDSPEVKAIMNERYGELIPTNELMVAPSDLHSSDNLEVVFENDK